MTGDSAARAAGMPPVIAPMLAVSGDLPSGDEEQKYSFELKWDGARTLAYVHDGYVRLLSRGGRDVTSVYPELAVLRELSGDAPCVVDGEVVALGATGKPDFARLQRRMNLTQPALVERARREVAVTFLAFDLLWRRGASLLAAPYDERRASLAELPFCDSRAAAPPSLAVSAEAALSISRAQQLEGVVAKRRDSTYLAGRRSECWLKVKNIQTVEVVIGGWTEGHGGRSSSFGALLVGLPDAAGGLRFAGRVGTGFDAQALDALLSRLRPLEARLSPFVDAVPTTTGRQNHWVQPVLVGEVAYGNWTRDARMRHPSWRGLRPDKFPEELEQETSASQVRPAAEPPSPGQG